MAKKATKKRAARKPAPADAKSITVSVRLDPITRYALELAARLQRRSMSQVLEWSIDEMTRKVEVPNTAGQTGGRSLHELVVETWSANEFETFVALAIQCPQLLDFDQQRRWHVIKNTPEFWDVDIDSVPFIEMTHFAWKKVLEKLPEVQIHVEEAAAESPVQGLSDEVIQDLGWFPDSSRPSSIPF